MLENHAANAIQQAIEKAGGQLPFDQFMELALYGPGYGYYVSGRQKFGVQGDFTTAPEISPIFSQCLANQCAQVLQQMDATSEILEFGAGSGRMAADMLQHLQSIDALPERYLIMELSPDLQATQQETLQQTVPDLLDKVTWIQQLPDAGWRGVIVANELLDAMPVHRFSWINPTWQELFIKNAESGFAEYWDDIQSAGLHDALSQLTGRVGELPENYQSEINLRLSPWLAAIAQFMAQGVLILMDYGYSEREYYHPERDQGTLICHYRHQATSNVLEHIGEQDITANVDFSALAHAALDNGFELAGYTNQAYFLMSNGLDQLLAAYEMNSIEQLDALQAIKQLTLPTEMGERFKVMALSRDVEIEMNGFRANDMRVYL